MKLKSKLSCFFIIFVLIPIIATGIILYGVSSKQGLKDAKITLQIMGHQN